jgi:hypothetical protein
LFGHCGYPLVIGFRLIAQSSGSKNLGPSPCWMMAPNLSGRTVLGHHHPATIPRTITVLIRTTTRKARPAAKAAARFRSFEMATRDIPIAIKNNRMRPGESISQINRYVVLNKCILFEIKARRGVRKLALAKSQEKESFLVASLPGMKTRGGFFSKVSESELRVARQIGKRSLASQPRASVRFFKVSSPP